jgi:hypothetical protein
LREDHKYQEFKKIKTLQEDFAHITRNFDLEDWRTVRTEYYWRADKMSTVEALEHKIELIEYYNRYGIPKG